MCFPVNFTNFLRTTFLQNTSGQLPLNILLNLRENTSARVSIQCVYFIKFKLYQKRDSGTDTLL